MSEERILYDGLTLDIDFEYQPETKDTMSDPGDYEDVTINTVHFCYIDVTYNYSNEQIKEMELMLLNREIC